VCIITRINILFVDREIAAEFHALKKAVRQKNSGLHAAGLRLDLGAILRRLQMKERRASSHAMNIHCKAAAKSER
jgi:hypothetical protein